MFIYALTAYSDSTTRLRSATEEDDVPDVEKIIKFKNAQMQWRSQRRMGEAVPKENKQ
jgi:hypothetical protein